MRQWFWDMARLLSGMESHNNGKRTTRALGITDETIVGTKHSVTEQNNNRCKVKYRKTLKLSEILKGAPFQQRRGKSHNSSHLCHQTLLHCWTSIAVDSISTAFASLVSFMNNDTMLAPGVLCSLGGYPHVSQCVCQGVCAHSGNLPPLPTPLNPQSMDLYIIKATHSSFLVRECNEELWACVLSNSFSSCWESIATGVPTKKQIPTSHGHGRPPGWSFAVFLFKFSHHTTTKQKSFSEHAF